MKNIVLLAFIAFCYTLQAQSDSSDKTKFTLGYYGETITHTGFTLGVEHAFFQNEKYKILIAANAGGYVHIRNNTSLFLRGQWGQRVTFDSGIFLDHFLGIGYLHQFTHGGAIYEVLPNGAVVETPNNGKSKFMPSIAVGTGYDFSKKGKHDLSVYIRPELFWKAPFNGYYLTHFALNAGIIFNL